MMPMNAVRLLLMLLMCLVTDAPSPVTSGLFEFLEDAEEIHAARRRKAVPLPPATRPAPPAAAAAVIRPPAPILRPPSFALPVAHDVARKIPAAAREPAAASDDH